MKKYIITLSAVALGGIAFLSCSRNFDEINTSKTQVTIKYFDPGLLFPRAMSWYSDNISGYQDNLIFQGYWVQGIAAPSSTAQYNAMGDKYVEGQGTLDYQSRMFTELYKGASNLYELQLQTNGDERYSNVRAVSKILEVFIISTISDGYGDVPYSEAFRAKEGLTRPKYDRQQELYPRLLSNLKTAVESVNLNESGQVEMKTYDPLYGGDLSKWKKLGYSVMLRMAMRMVKVAPALAKTWAEEAYRGGVFETQADEAVLKQNNTTGFPNNNARALNEIFDLYALRWSRPLIDNLKTNNDPRLAVIAEIPPAGLAANQNVALSGDNTASKQLGAPNGYDDSGPTVRTSIQNEPQYPGPTGTGADVAFLGNYSRPRGFYRDYDAPTFLITCYQVKFLLAEAKLRGFAISESAATLFRQGVEAAMQSLSAYGTTGVVPAAEIQKFIATLPAAPTIEDVNTQFWVSCCTTLSFVEAWNNWKRTGIPALVPVNYPNNATGGQIPRRERYPVSENSLNGASYTEAVSNMGGDTWTTRMWWDRQ